MPPAPLLPREQGARRHAGRPRVHGGAHDQPGPVGGHALARQLDRRDRGREEVPTPCFLSFRNMEFYRYAVMIHYGE